MQVNNKKHMRIPEQFNNACLVIAILVMAGCSVPKEVIAADAPPQQIEFETIGKGSLYGAGEEGIEESNLLIRSNQEWTGLKKNIDAVNKVSQNFKEHEVNFDEYYLIVCFDRVRPNGGYSIKVKDVLEREEQIEVLIERPKPQGMAISVLIQPYHIIRIPITDKEVLFRYLPLK
jgi:hypothetical protein